MPVVGTLGRKIVFEVSDKRALVIQNMSRDSKGRWTTHNTVNKKPKSEFLGPDLQTVSISIYLSSNLGVRPRSVLNAINAMVENGTAEYLIIGNRPVSKNRFKLISASETWDKIYSRGELAKAKVSISLEEYV